MNAKEQRQYLRKNFGQSWVTSDCKVFPNYSSARYHEIVLKLRKLIKKGN